MPERKVLLADNDTDFLDIGAEFLEMAGYNVRKASGLDEARHMLVDDWVHLAILDLRLENDEDEKDVSGLTLAKESTSPIPKIMLSKFPTWEAVRESLGGLIGDRPPAFDFVAKQEGLNSLLQHIQRVFAEHVHISWSLTIDWKARDRFSLVNLIEPGLDGDSLLNRADELEDIFRQLFYKKSQIRVDQLLWQRVGRIALTVFAFKEGASPEHIVVVCGQNVKVADEARRYYEFAPKVPDDTGTVLTSKAETTHFAANAYILAGADLENVQSLTERYRSGPEKLFNATLNTLFAKTLTAWHQDKRILEEVKMLDEVYREQLGLSEDRLSRDEFIGRIEALIRQIPALGTRIELADGILTIQFDRRAFSYLNPTPFLYQMSDLERPVILINAPGTLSSDNVLTDANGNSWLTDFVDAGRVPLLWNFVALEATIRFDWPEEKNIQWLHGMEQCLTTGEFTKFNLSDVEPPLRKSARAIQVVRKSASRTLGKDTRSYHVGILFQAASRIATFDPAIPLMPSEIARLTHALTAAAMICARITSPKQGITMDPSPMMRGLRLDKENYAVKVGDTPISLRGQGFDLLCYLYEHPNKLCTRRELVEQGLKEKFDEQDRQQISRLNTAMGRLRERIEPDPDRPIYLITEAGAGYRLVIDPPT